MTFNRLNTQGEDTVGGSPYCHGKARKGIRTPLTRQAPASVNIPALRLRIEPRSCE
jgi:hypothetical protein